MKIKNSDLEVIQEKLRISCFRKHARNQINFEKEDISQTREFILHNEIADKIENCQELSFNKSENQLYYLEEPIKVHCFDFSRLFSSFNMTIYVYANSREQAETFMIERFKNKYFNPST